MRKHYCWATCVLIVFALISITRNPVDAKKLSVTPVTVKTAAAAAGAAQQQRLSDESTGRALRSEAIQVGERYPGQSPHGRVDVGWHAQV